MTSQWARWRLKSPTSPLFTQPFIRVQIKENIKAPRHWPLWGEFTGTGEFPTQMASNVENVSNWWRHHGVAINHPRPHFTGEWTQDVNCSSLIHLALMAFWIHLCQRSTVQQVHPRWGVAVLWCLRKRLCYMFAVRSLMKEASPKL